MNVTVFPKPLHGKIPAIPSKSFVHRLLICAALGDKETFLPCIASSQDIEATVSCLSGLGAGIIAQKEGFNIVPIRKTDSEPAYLDCCESGSTYRFLAPLVCALGRTAHFSLCGKLPQRPMDALWSALIEHGAVISGQGTAAPVISGAITHGRYEIAGDISSQYISGLLFALPLLCGDSEIVITGEAQSLGYIQITLNVLKEFGIKILPTESGFIIPGGQKYVTPEAVVAEGDWSNASFWLCAAAAGKQKITVSSLNTESCQGDRAVCDILQHFGADVKFCGDAVTVRTASLRGININAENIPDLVPAVAVVAAAAEGTTVISNVGRLRLKESDRVRTVCDTICTLGGQADVSEGYIVIHGTGVLSGGMVSACGDHRIAMMAAALSVICRNKVTISGAEAVCKSYPGFFEDFTALGGFIEKGEN